MQHTYHISWRAPDEKAMSKFQEHVGAHLPAQAIAASPGASKLNFGPGITVVGSWHALGAPYGFIVVRAEDVRLLHAALLSWKELDTDITPVLTDDEVLSALSQTQAKPA